jgi:hypothetical protein
MDIKLKSYLKTTVSRIKNPSRRKSAYRELRTHLLDLIDKKIADGLDETTARNEALKGLPEPRKFGKKLNQAGLPWFWRYPVITVSVATSLLIVFSVIIGSHLFVTQYLKPKLAEYVVPNKKVLEYMVRDLKQLSQLEVFPRSERKKNAAFFLNSKIGGIDQRGSTSDELIKIEMLLKKYYGWQENEKQFQLLLSEPTLNEIDTTWLSQLEEFDYIDFTVLDEIQNRIRPLKESNSIEKISVWSSLPTLEIATLQNWVVAYVLQMHKKGQTNKALTLTRHIARLVHSNGSLVDHMVAISILKKENILAEFLKAKWTPFSLEILEAHKRVSWGWPGILNQSYYHGELPPEFKQYAKRELGLCSGVGEYFMGFQGMSDFLYPQAPFETSFRSELLAAKSLAEKLLKKCDRYDQFRFFLEETPKEKNSWWDKDMIAIWSLNGSHNMFNYFPNPSRLPYFRRVFIYYLMGVAIPNYTRLYEDLIEKEKEEFKNAANTN